MRIRDIMTTKVITIPSNTNVAKAEDIMSTHNVSRLPVVDKGKLVGIVSRKRIMKTTAPESAPIAIWRLPHFFFGMKVKEIMIRDVVTVTPDMTVEGAALIAQSKKVGATPVVEGDRLVGIVSSNDYYNKILNPLLGIGQKRQRLVIKKPIGAKSIQEVFGCIAKHNAKVIAASYINMERKGIETDLAISLDTKDATQIVADLRDLGYDVEVR